MDLQPLMMAIREAAGDRVWSAGVKLARDGRVVGERSTDDEVVLSVAVPGATVAPKVYLWPGDEDWTCDCDREACAHAAAAVIALSRALKAGKPLPKPKSLPTLRYAIRRVEGGLALGREVVRYGDAEPLKGPLQSTGVALTEADQRIDATLTMGERNLPAAAWRRILEALEGAGSAVTLDDEPVKVSGETVPPVALVKDHGDGWRVTLHRPAGVSESFRGGVMRVGQTLRPADNGGLSPNQRSGLIRGVIFGPDEVGRLVGDFLPRLRHGVTVKIKSDRLPAAEASPPRALLTLTPVEEGLEIEASIVYGDPPTARVQQDRLVQIGRVIPVRDRSAEVALRRKVDEAIQLPVGRKLRLDGPAALDFVRTRLPVFPGDVAGEPGRWRVREQPVRVRLERYEGGEGGGLGMRVRSEASASEIAAAWQEGRSLVQLTDGGFAPLPVDLLTRHGHAILDLLQSADADGALPSHAAGPAAAVADDLGASPPDLSHLRPLVDGFEGVPAVPLPEGLQATLRGYQKDGADWLAFLRSAGLSGILADDMGLGKTLQALCALGSVEGPSLVVAPTSVLRNWVSEAARFMPRLRCCLYHGPSRKLDKTADIIVTSYAIVRLDPALSAVDWRYVVLDEAQAIKNPDSQTARAVFGLKSEHRLSLTGTPVENRLDELFSQLHFLMPGFLGTRAGFRERYARPAEAGDLAAARALRARIKPFVLRRLKQDVAKDLPPRTDVVRYCQLTVAQKRGIELVRAASQAKVMEALGAKRTLEVLEYLLRLRQGACHAALLPGRAPESAEADSGKLTVLMEELDRVIAEGHKALVFSQWTGFLDLIQVELRAAGFEHLRLDGSTRDRQGLVDRFQAEDGPPVFLISLKAGGTGLNLTAADYVFHTDPWWNPAVEDQATDRAHRIGQSRPVISVKLVSEGTVEEKILALQARKRQLASAAIGDEAEFVRGIDREDLRALLS